MKHLFKLILAIIWMAAAARATTLSGTLKMPDGTLANGYLYFSLSQQGIQLTTGSCAGPAVLSPVYQVPFKVTNGAITTLLGGSPVVVGNDCITPANTYYYVTFRDLQGNILFKETWPIAGTTLDVGTITPIRIAQGTSDLGASFIPGTAGTGTELQYRVSTSSLGAVAGSSVDTSGNVTLLSLIQAADAARLDSGGLKLASNKVLGFSSTTASGGSLNTGLSVGGAGNLRAGNGTVGDFTGSFTAATLNASNGTNDTVLKATQISVGSAGVIGFTNNAAGSAGSFDTGISRDSAGVFDFGNGTAGNVSGSAKMAALILNGSTLNSVSGNSGKVAQSSGTLTSGNCLKSDANANIVDNGGACGGGVFLLAKDFVSRDHTGTTTEDTIYTTTITGNTLGTTGGFRGVIYVAQSNAASGTATYRVKFGGTTLHSITSSVTDNDIIEFWFGNTGSASSNNWNYRTTGGTQGQGHSGGGIDTTVNQTFSFTIQNSTSGAQQRAQAYILERVN